MQSALTRLAIISIAALAGTAAAQPSLTSIGSGSPSSVTNSIGGTIFIGGSGFGSGSSRWSVTGGVISGQDLGGSGGGFVSANGAAHTGFFPNTGPTILGNTAASVTPAFRPDPTLVPAVNQPAATELAGRWWNSTTQTWQSMGGLPIDGSLIAFGSSSSGGSTGSFLTPNGISPTGRFVVGLGYVCTYNNAGTAVSANTFRWRPWIWDAQGNGGAGEMKILPTPFKTTAGQTSLRRTGNAYAVSGDGLVVAGATEHNVGTTPSADADGGRLCYWRRADLNSPFVLTYLDTGVDGSGFPKYISSTPSSMDMNADGTIIVARGPDGITKWVWNGVDFGAPIVIGSNLTTPATWLPASVTSCGIPPNLGGILATSDDGNTIVGSAVYSTCGSFMSGGFIWTADDNLIEDWYDYNVAAGTPGCTPGGFWGPIGDNGDNTRGLPVIGNPNSISGDGSIIVGNQGGTQRIAGAPPWVWIASGGPTCVEPSIVSQPAATTNFSACTSSILLSTALSGTAPFTYQWYKDGQPLFNGTQTSGSVVSGANEYLLRVNPPLTPSDTGTYYVVVNGQCGSSVQSNNAVVQLDPAFPAATNDICTTALTVNMGTNVLGAGESACGAYINDPDAGISCLTQFPKADRWYVFTPETTGDYRIETCGSNFDTVLSVFDSCGGNELACNNDHTVGPSTGCTAQRSRIGSINLNAMQPYYIRIAAPASAFLSATSVMNLSIMAAPPAPANDYCFDATVAVLGANAFDTTEATNDGQASCQTALSRDVWFQYTPGGNGILRASTCPGTSWNTVLSMYDGGCGGTELSCNDNANITGCSTQSILANQRVQGGTTYFFRIGGNTLTAFGAGVFTLDFQCFADFNGDGGVDGADVEAFFTAWEAGSPAADVNLDGGTDGGDVEAFFNSWENGDPVCAI
ncbi:MAG: hypothetical protein JNK25_04830 [Phycisphaerae bacterium]|nr:hypothetical protein [Phycisphaerae bacterium]